MYNIKKQEYLNDLLEPLKKYMYIDENITRMIKEKDISSQYNTNTNINTHIKTNKKSNNITDVNNNNGKTDGINEDIFYPFQKDKLFWCFYILVEGMNEYNLSKQHSFQIEREYKVAYYQEWLQVFGF